VVFIEGPHEAQAMIEFLVDRQTRPPVAIYSSFRDDAAAGMVGQGGTPPRYSAWYPLVSYSPEMVAMEAMVLGHYRQTPRLDFFRASS
jgi:hypothetical protein